MIETQRKWLLKGRFLQALLPRWQQILGTPNVDESFTDLYNHARTAERHDQQYCRESHESSRSKKHPSTDKREVPSTSHESGEPSTQPRRRVSIGSSVLDVVVLGISDGIVPTKLGVPICLRTKVIKLHHETEVKPRGPFLTHLDQRQQLLKLDHPLLTYLRIQ